MAKVIGLDHVSILVKDADKSLAFYQEFLGVEPVSRPDLGFAGYWVDLSHTQTLHIMQLHNPYTEVKMPSHGGRDYHFALRVDDLAEFCRILDEKNHPYQLSKSGRKALFTRDLDDNVIELTQID